MENGKINATLENYITEGFQSAYDALEFLKRYPQYNSFVKDIDEYENTISVTWSNPENWICVDFEDGQLSYEWYSVPEGKLQGALAPTVITPGVYENLSSTLSVFDEKENDRDIEPINDFAY